ncbi:hypothetical protein [[Kitasatospora] papulosa]|uniref:hypothetical protein n=1 Tax=[Kitasatospora] papulosa TaxID=1464011 RepID=UPI0036358B52
MRMLRVVGLAAGLVLGAGLVVGCGSGEGGAEPSASAVVVGVEEALDAYQEAAAPGCVTADECQALVTAKLRAAVGVRSAMRAEDATRFAEPIGFVDLAEKRAEHYGLDNLGAKGNSLAVSQPLQQMVAWFREHPGV